MTRLQIILATWIILTGIQPAGGQQFAPPPQPAASPPYFPPTSPMPIQPAPQAVPVFPPQSTVVPLPSHTPGSVFGPPMQPTTTAPNSVLVGPSVPETLPPPPSVVPSTAPQPPLPSVPALANPIAVPVVDEELAWDQIVDVVTDYFTVSRELRARRGGEIWSEGRIETAYQSGATWLEAQRGDSVGSFNRWESTFQTIRRRAAVRVVPDATGYLVEVIVEKELEDLPNPEKATAGAAIFLNDNALPSRRMEQVSRTRSSPCWIPLGRDPPLEQRMLAEIHARLCGAATQGSIFAR